MSIVDAIIIICIILAAMGGLKRGALKETVYLIGVVLLLILSYKLKDFLALYMFKYLPFFSFNGIFEGVTALNILVYEVIAFLTVFSILYIILRLILRVTGLIEFILKLTVVFGFISKLIGAVIGAIEGYILVFVVLFCLNQPFINVPEIENSKVGNWILDNTPFMSEAVKGTRDAINEVYDLSVSYKDNKKGFNKRAIDLFIKYDIISQENVNILREKGKLD